ncbi:MAG: N-acetylmuramoyl-L-alanine amidase [Candidatus Accumulibacter sp.]|jgi:N-acetylmuramoyl-L-alanine amidase|nr:N-acetylmuramoyl-L-alanine amidase [Accumulibacter sp.]
MKKTEHGLKRTRKASFTASGLSLCGLVALAFLPLRAVPAPRPEVAVDVGHTVKDYGALSARGFKEFDLNRNLAEKTALALEKLKLRTLRVNFDGRIARLDERPKQAARADFFISIHHDSVQPELLEEWEWKGEKLTYSDKHAGFSLFVSRKSPDLETSLRCASAIGARLRRSGFLPTTHHGDSIAGTPRPYADRANAVHYYDTLVVLYRTTLPAVLFEAGVVKHRAEEAALRDPKRQALMAGEIATGIAACLFVKPAREHLVTGAG